MHETLFAILTGLSLVFAGILVGYFLWFRDRVEQIALAKQLTIERERLAGECREQLTRMGDLQDQLERRAAKAHSMQQLCDDLLASREKTIEHSGELESELYSARKKLDEAREQLTGECQLRAKSEESLHVAQRNFLESLAKSDTQWRLKLTGSQSRAAQLETELNRLTETQQQTAERLHEANATAAGLRSELDSQRQILEIARTNAAGLEQEYVTLETSRRSQQEQLNESRGRAAAAESEKKMAADALEQSQRHIDVLLDQVRRLEGERAEADSVHARGAELEQMLEIGRTGHLALARERDATVQRCAGLEVALTAVQKRSENQESTIGALRSQAAAGAKRLNEVLTERQQDRDRFETAAREQAGQLQSMQGKLAESEGVRIRHEATLLRVSEQNAGLLQSLKQLQLNVEPSRTAQEMRSRMDSVLRQRDNAFDQIRSLTDELGQMKKHMRSNEETIRNLRRERGAVLLRSRQMPETFPRIHSAPAAGPSASEQLAHEYGGVTRIDTVRGIVFVESPRVQDDLKLIHGVGEVLEQRLNDFGIYSFKQIMLWNDRAIDKFSELLIFKDRIRRDDWPGQAKRLNEQSDRRGAA